MEKKRAHQTALPNSTAHKTETGRENGRSPKWLCSFYPKFQNNHQKKKYNKKKWKQRQILKDTKFV